MQTDSRAIHTGGLAVHTRGKGPVVLLLHGAPSTVSHFERLAQSLAADGHRVILPELPGYGQSARLKPYNFDHAHALLEDALVQLDVNRCAIVAHSGGVYRGAALAARGRVRVQGLLALAGGIHFQDSRSDLLGIVRLLETPIPDPTPILVQRFLSARWRDNLAALADVGSWMSTTTQASLRDEIEAFTSAPDMRAAFGATQVPFVCRVGTDDSTDAMHRAQAMIAAAPTAGRLEVVEDAGHALLIEDFEGTRASLRDFLGTVV